MRPCSLNHYRLNDIKTIVRIQLDLVQNRVKDQGIQLTFSDAALAFLAEQGYVPEFGARPLKRAVQQLVVSPLAVEILKSPDKKMFIIDQQNNRIVIS